MIVGILHRKVTLPKAKKLVSLLKTQVTIPQETLEGRESQMLIQALLLALAKKHQAADYQQKVQILALYLSLSTWIPTEKNPNWALKKSGSRNQSDKKPLTFSNRPWPRDLFQPALASSWWNPWCFGDLRPPGTEAEAKVMTWDPNLSTETEPIQVDLGDETTHPCETTGKTHGIFMGRFVGYHEMNMKKTSI